ncbi:hypothetical protein D3C78_1149160 [compost metagenome]
MDMHRQRLIGCRQDLLHLAQFHRTQRMETQALVLQGLINQLTCDHLLLFQIAVRILNKTSLPRLGRLAAEPGVAVQHRQQRHTDPRLRRRLTEPTGHFAAIGIRIAVGTMMQIVELCHLGVSAFQHFDIQLACNDLDLLRRQPLYQAVHQIAPGPETVLRIARHLRQPGHRTLKGVRVKVWHARHRIAVQTGATFGIGVGSHLSQVTLRIHVQPDVMRPTFRKQSA